MASLRPSPGSRLSLFCMPIQSISWLAACVYDMPASWIFLPTLCAASSTSCGLSICLPSVSSTDIIFVPPEAIFFEYCRRSVYRGVIMLPLCCFSSRFILSRSSWPCDVSILVRSRSYLVMFALHVFITFFFRAALSPSPDMIVSSSGIFDSLCLLVFLSILEPEYRSAWCRSHLHLLSFARMYSSLLSLGPCCVAGSEFRVSCVEGGAGGGVGGVFGVVLMVDCLNFVVLGFGVVSVFWVVGVGAVSVCVCVGFCVGVVLVVGPLLVLMGGVFRL